MKREIKKSFIRCMSFLFILLFFSASAYAYAKENYTIGYVLNGGENSINNPTSYTQTTPTIELEDPTRTGYVFEGWYSDEEFTQLVEIIEQGSAGDKTLYAKWEVETYSITYNLYGGKNHEDNPLSYDITTGEITLMSPSRAGSTFVCWYSDEEFTQPVKRIKKGSTGDRILYARWTTEKYTITYNLDGGKKNTNNPSSYRVTTEDIVLEAPTKKGYVFKGWYSDEEFTQPVEIIRQGSTGNITLYAKWEEETYKITYKLNKGKNHKNNPSEYTVTTEEITLKDPSRDGYKFKGWYSDEKFTERVIRIKQGSIGDRTLYAKWEKTNYTIQYVLNGGTNHSKNPTGYQTSSSDIKLREPSRIGHTFKGWYTNKKLTSKSKVTSIKKGTFGDIVLYARWETNKYLDVRELGAIPDDKKNDTKAFQKALYFASVYAENGDGPTAVYVPAGVYRITATDPNSKDTGISVRSNTKLIMDKNATLYVEGGNKADYAVIKAIKANNITIKGGKIKGERYRHKGNKGESGHGLSILGCKNVVIQDMSIASNWGDGIYLGTWHDAGTGKYTGNKKIKIKKCKITDNRRNNISIIDADNVTIDSCKISDAHGTAPQCGICIEPNKGSTSGDQICSDITIKDTTISAYKKKNAVNYWCFMTTAYGSQSTQPSSWVTAKNIKFENCTFNGYVANYSGNNLKVDKKTKFNGTFVSWRKYTKVK